MGSDIRDRLLDPESTVPVERGGTQARSLPKTTGRVEPNKPAAGNVGPSKLAAGNVVPVKVAPANGVAPVSSAQSARPRSIAMSPNSPSSSPIIRTAAPETPVKSSLTKAPPTLPAVASRNPRGRVYRAAHFLPVDPRMVRVEAEEREEPTLQQEVVRETPVYLTSFFVHLVLLILLALVVWQSETPLGVLLVASADTGESATTPLEVDFSLLSNDPASESEQSELAPSADSAPLSSAAALPTSLTPTRYISGDGLSLRDGYSGISDSGVEMKPSAARALREHEAYKSKAKFFNVGAEGNRFVFVIDASGSMVEGNRWQMAVRELLKAVEALEEDQEFFVFLYSSGTSPMFDMKPRDIKLHAATPENYNKLYQWMESRFPLGSTLPRSAMKMAIDLNPDAIYLLSDGEIQDDTYEFLLNYNKPRERPDRSPSKIPIHTIALDFSLGGFYLRNIADSNNGKFTQKFSE